jgi:hypothetical protein
MYTILTSYFTRKVTNSLQVVNNNVSLFSTSGGNMRAKHNQLGHGNKARLVRRVLQLIQCLTKVLNSCMRYVWAEALKWADTTHDCYRMSKQSLIYN